MEFNTFIICGFTKEEIIKKYNIDRNIKCIDGLDNISDYKSDYLIINLDNINDLYKELSDFDEQKYKKYDLYEFDRLNRIKFSNFKKVYIVSLDHFFNKYHFKSLYSNLNFIDDDEKIIILEVQKKEKISFIKNKNIEKLKEYVDKQDTYFNSKDIMKYFNVSNRWIKRYMKDMNDLYNNIGYSYSKRQWYKIKKR